MESDELLARTAQYRVQYPNTTRRRRSRRGPLSQEYLNSVRSPLQSLEREALINPDSRSDSGNDLANYTAPTESSVSNPMAGFRVTTEYDGTSGRSIYDQENGDELPSVTEIERLHMEQAEDDFLCSDSDESDSDDTTELSLFNRRRRELLRHIRNLEEEAERERRRREPNTYDPLTLTSRYYPEFDSANQELLKPNARFFIERSKSMVSIKFDPPP